MNNPLTLITNSPINNMTDANIMDSKVHFIEDIFSERYSFIIPHYQRPYAWTEKETERLLDDLIYSMGDEGTALSDVDSYFLGIIILVKNQNSEHEILDGQQRLATLTILLGVLRELLLDQKTFFNQLIYQENSTYINGSPRPRLALRNNDQKFFEKYLENSEYIRSQNIDKEQLPPQEQRIINNGEILRTKIEEKLDTPTKKQRLVDFLLERCYVLVACTTNLNSAYRIFSCLNDRGLPLSIPDILKADLIGKFSGKQYESLQPKEALENHYSQRWEKFEEQLGREDFETLFRYLAIFDMKPEERKKDSKEVTKKVLEILKTKRLEDFRNYAKQKDKPERFIDNYLAPFVDAFDRIKKPHLSLKTDDLELRKLFCWLNNVNHPEWRIPGIFYLRKYHNHPDKILKFFQKLERLAVSLMILEIGEEERVKRYIKILDQIRTFKITDDFNTQKLELTVHQNEQNKIIKFLENKNIGRSKKKEALLYILLRLDNFGSDRQGIEDRWKDATVEHVLPQRPHPKSQWYQWFSSQEERSQYIHLLGNLILLSKKQNNRAKNYDFDKKKEIYLNPRPNFSLVMDLLPEQTWTPEVINKRQKRLVRQLKHLWNLTYRDDQQKNK
ncbi:MAG: DUF262 domain-containing protein [Crocosphaera sp.]